MTSMKAKPLFYILIAGTLLFAAYNLFAYHNLDTTTTAPSVPNKDDALHEVVNRLTQLEHELSVERNARKALEKMLGQPSESDEELSMVAMIESTQQETIDSDGASLVDAEAEMATFRKQQRAQMLKQFQPEFKIQELVNAGFNKDEANWIINSETEVQLEQLQAQYDARREALNGSNTENNGGDQLRNKLGDEYYERYLRAKGMPTSISVGSVMSNSPGENAGLQAGDEIVAYDNKRVFSVYGLNRMTATGKEGQSVLIEINRNGESVQLTIPRGPIGVQSNQFGRRR